MIGLVLVLALLQLPAIDAAPSLIVQEEARGLTFSPQDGTKLERTIRIAHALELTSTGQGPATGELRRSAGDLRIESQLDLEVVDELLVVAGGRAEKLKRRLRVGQFNVEFGPKVAKVPRAKHKVRSPLEDVSVLYAWSPQEGRHGRFYDEKEAMEEFLAHLAEDADLRALLPTRPVRPNESWSVEPARLVDVFAPGGRLPWAWPRELDRAMVRSLSTGLGGGLGEIFGGTAKGKVEATMLRVELRDGAELAIVKLVLDMDLERDQGEFAPDTTALDEGADAPRGPATRTRWTFTGTGELVWNLTAGRSHSLRVSGNQRVVSSMKVGATRQELELAGTLALEYGVR